MENGKNAGSWMRTESKKARIIVRLLGKEGWMGTGKGHDWHQTLRTGKKMMVQGSHFWLTLQHRHLGVRVIEGF